MMELSANRKNRQYFFRYYFIHSFAQTQNRSTRAV